ncbi:alpha/beta hydrolase [Shimia sp. FJ5]|uniref:alpha/beta hydrolase n=1 Tax=Shimia sp. FJ5 TaxID=3079054 RepID=UPI002618C981|nr:alpha/beta hydrolase [Shimia sp. FJ5]MDV4143357.1 alpha/beta hydrolase [Shimia sp. FJ5]
MPLIRINADGQRPVLHGAPHPVAPVLFRALAAPGPIVIMVHGFKFLPGDPRHCPHTHIFSTGESHDCPKALSWPRQLGFGRNASDEGLAIAFGWSARSGLRAARQEAETAARALAELVAMLSEIAPDRPVNLIAHSLGAHLVLSAMQRVARGVLGRVILLNGATYQSHAEAALAASGGQGAELLNIVSRENAPYDFLFEKVLPSEQSGDRALGRGLRARNALTVRLDDPRTLETLADMGHVIAPRRHRHCHWSTYLRPGVFPFYNALIRTPARLPLQHLQDRLATPQPQVRPVRRIAFLPPAMHQGRKTSG